MTSVWSHLYCVEFNLFCVEFSLFCVALASVFCSFRENSYGFSAHFTTILLEFFACSAMPGRIEYFLFPTPHFSTFLPQIHSFFVVLGRMTNFLLPTPRFCRLAGRGNNIFPYTPHMAHFWTKFIIFWARAGRIAHFSCVYAPRLQFVHNSFKEF